MLADNKIEPLPETDFAESYYYKVIMGCNPYMTVNEWEDRAYSHRITPESVSLYVNGLKSC